MERDTQNHGSIEHGEQAPDFLIGQWYRYPHEHDKDSPSKPRYTSITPAEALSQKELEQLDAAFNTRVSRVEGLQVGEHNHQENVFVRKLESSEINLEQLLNKPKVREILGVLAANPKDAAVARKADSVLGSGPRFLESRGEITVRELKNTGTGNDSGYAYGFFGFNLLVEDSRGVQVGNNLVQENEFIFYLESDLTATQLLAQSPEARRAIIDSVRQLGLIPTSDPEVIDGLASALEDASSGIAGVPSEGRVIEPTRRGGVLHIQDELGVTIGHAVTQENSTQIAIATPRILATCARLGDRTHEHGPQDNDAASRDFASGAFEIKYTRTEAEDAATNWRISYGDSAEHSDRSIWIPAWETERSAERSREDGGYCDGR